MTFLPGANLLCLRPAMSSDEPFLLDLYRRHHQSEFSALPAAQQRILLPLQFRARQQGYAQTFPHSLDQIILLEDVPAGRLWTADLSQEHRIVDLSLLPEQQSQGIGTLLLTNEIARAAAASMPLRLSVHHDNARARGLYTRLGFLTIDGGPFHLTLESRNQPRP